MHVFIDPFGKKTKEFQKRKKLKPLLEHLYRDPGWPLMVYASDTFGAAPVKVDCLRTLMMSLSHHSPTHYNANHPY